MATIQEAHLSSGIRDNHRRGNIGDFLRTHISPGCSLSIVSAFFTIYAFEALKRELNSIGRLRFLFGEPRYLKTLDPDRTEKKAFDIARDGLALRNRLTQKQAAFECAEWIRRKVDIKSITRANLLHGKMYHIENGGIAEAIFGSSNFTVNGLGLGATNNIELNLVVDSRRDRDDLKVWFDELWRDSSLVTDVKDEVLRYLEQLYVNHDPEFIYFKTLFHLFEDYLSRQEESGLGLLATQIVDTTIWETLFEFQKDAVKGAINKIQRHNGCILADSVGLGKTFEALAIIKYYELRNQRILVLCPKKLRENWTIYQAQNNSPLNPFIEDRFSYTVLCHTDLSRDGGYSGDINLENINWGNYDLVVIDESHNFRNNTKGKRDDDGNVIRKSRYERLLDDIIKSGVNTKVLLLSATPVNNSLSDLRNQLRIITRDEDDFFQKSIGISSLRDALSQAQKTFTHWSKQSEQRTTKQLLESLSSSFFKLLDELTIARSRKHILKYYKDSVAEVGGFPERLPPMSRSPEIDSQKEFLSYDKLNDEISGYQLSLFNPSRYVLSEYRRYYDQEIVRNFRQSDRERFLIGMMKVNFLKRLESSVVSFATTLGRTTEKIKDLERSIGLFIQYRNQNLELDFDQLSASEIEDEEVREAFEVGKGLKYKLIHLNVDGWLRDLKRDREQLEKLYLSARSVTPERDSKLTEVKALIKNKVLNPTSDKSGRPNRKVLLFTAFADTAEYLHNQLDKWAREELGIEAALVSGGTIENRTSFGRNQFDHILTNFSPVSKNRAKKPFMQQDKEIDLLIATDCISEGQNLQDCDYLINYDIHWNPVRIIQRFGRIDRIGSINPAVQLVNFWPTNDLNKYINLKNRVEARMALVDVTATQGDNLLEIESLVEDELKYRDKQLLRMQKEILDLEDFNESVTLNEFTLEDFRVELSRYIENNRQKLQDAPLGLYAVVPRDPAVPLMQPGVVFCLKQPAEKPIEGSVNPTHPYFLTYIRHDGTVRLTFAQPKQILEICRLLCAGKAVPYDRLCELFDHETNNGSDMSTYSDLLQLAVSSISQTFRKRVVSTLTNSRGGVIPKFDQQATEDSEFELITWLVIKD